MGFSANTRRALGVPSVPKPTGAKLGYFEIAIPGTDDVWRWTRSVVMPFAKAEDAIKKWRGLHLTRGPIVTKSGAYLKERAGGNVPPGPLVRPGGPTANR